MTLIVKVEEGEMTVCEIAYRHQLIAKDRVAAKRERDAQDKRKREQRPLLNQKRHA